MLCNFVVVCVQADGKSKVIHVDSFTEDLFFKMVDQLLNNRDKDMDVVFSSLWGRGKGREGVEKEKEREKERDGEGGREWE